MVEICEAAQALPPVEGPPRVADLLLEGYTLVMTAGHAAAASALKQAAEAVAVLSAQDILRWGWLTNAAFLMLWDLDGLHRSCVRQLQIVRDAGALSEPHRTTCTRKPGSDVLDEPRVCQCGAHSSGRRRPLRPLRAALRLRLTRSSGSGLCRAGKPRLVHSWKARARLERRPGRSSQRGWRIGTRRPCSSVSAVTRRRRLPPCE